MIASSPLGERQYAGRVSSRAEPSASRTLEREWWLRTLLVLQSPRAVFAALRDDSDEAAAARQEPMTAIVFLAGISIFLSTSTAAHLFDDAQIRGDVLLLAVESIVAGLLVGLQNFCIAGGALYLGARGMGGKASYRQARHVIGLATAPFIVSLVLVWPVRLALYGGDVFRSGGSDDGADGRVFQGIDAAFVAWAVGLVLLGVRTVNRWSWLRSLGALGYAALLFAGLALLFVLL